MSATSPTSKNVAALLSPPWSYLRTTPSSTRCYITSSRGWDLDGLCRMSSIGVPDQAALSGDCTRTFTRPKPDLCIPFVRAAGHAFQKTSHSSAEDEDHQVTLSSSAIVKYVGIEKRDGLVSVGRRLLEGDRTLSRPISSLMSAIRCPA